MKHPPLDIRVLSGLGFADADQTPGKQTTSVLVWSVLSAVSSGLSGYHGYKRNGGSVGWGVAWFLLGGLFPIITPTVAFAQGFGKRSR